MLMAIQTLRIAIASTLKDSGRESALRTALILDPVNSDLDHQLGLGYLSSLDESRQAEGLRLLRRATELNPHEAVYWSDLASGCELVGDFNCTGRAFARALALSPRTPQLLWMAANYRLRRHQTDDALPLFRHLLELAPDYAWPTFHICLEVLDDPQAVLDNVLPAGEHTELKLAYVDYLTRHDRADSAFRVWGEIVPSSTMHPGVNPPSFTYSSVSPYVDSLLDLGRNEEAVAVWRNLESLGVVTNPPSGVKGREDSESLVFNGSFERPPLNSGLDWRYQKPLYFSLDFSALDAYQGAHCLRLSYDLGRNDEAEPVYQIVPVTPHQSYLLTAFARSKDLTSDSGPRLRVRDPSCPACLNVSTESTLGTTPWHPVWLTFSTGVHTRFVRLSVWRSRSRTFPTEITGDFWLDAVSVKPLNSVRTSVPVASLLPRLGYAEAR